MADLADDDPIIKWRLGPPRKYREANVGDVINGRTVTRLLPRGYKGRSDERVAWRCSCGKTGKTFVYNLRNLKPHVHEQAARLHAGLVRLLEEKG